jgi:hypothetical protein
VPESYVLVTLTIRAARKPCGLEGVRIVKDPLRRGSRGQKTEEEQPRTDANLGQGRDHECESNTRHGSYPKPPTLFAPYFFTLKVHFFLPLLLPPSSVST